MQRHGDFVIRLGDMIIKFSAKDCKISGHHPAQSPARQAERQRGDKV